MIRILIVDDEAPARRKLLRLLDSASDVEVVGEATNGRAAVEAITNLRPDLVFLDVRMPGLDGFGVIETVGARNMPHVVFVTAYDEYAVKAFEVQALDYLMKPISPSRFAFVLDRARRQMQAGTTEHLAKRLDDLLARVVEKPRFLERIMVTEDERSHLVALDEVDRIEAARNYVCLHSKGKTYMLRRSISELAGQLNPSRFLRLNRSQIVHLNAIKEFQSWFHGDYRVILKDGTELRWSRRYGSRQRLDFTVE
jgi:two-component system LytT family response regulator